MEILGLIMVITGGICAAVGAIWLLVGAFQKSMGWGLMYIFVPFAAVVYLFTDWDRAKKAFFIWLAGSIIAVYGTTLIPKRTDAVVNSSIKSTTENTVDDSKSGTARDYTAASEKPAVKAEEHKRLKTKVHRH